MLLAVMFVAFIVQIVFRYLFNFPIGWTSELTVITWLWLVLWGAAFVVSESEEIRFDLIYGAVGPRARAASWRSSPRSRSSSSTACRCRRSVDYVSFMKVETTAYLKIRFDWLFSIYVIFAVAVIVRYVWILWQPAARQGRRRQPIRPRRAPACESDQPVLARRPRRSSP